MHLRKEKRHGYDYRPEHIDVEEVLKAINDGTHLKDLATITKAVKNEFNAICVYTIRCDNSGMFEHNHLLTDLVKTISTDKLAITVTEKLFLQDFINNLYTEEKVNFDKYLYISKDTELKPRAIMFPENVSLHLNLTNEIIAMLKKNGLQQVVLVLKLFIEMLSNDRD